MGMGMQQWHRRHAMMLASQLPDKQEDAAHILAAMIELSEHFMATDPAEPVVISDKAVNGAKSWMRVT